MNQNINQAPAPKDIKKLKFQVAQSSSESKKKNSDKSNPGKGDSSSGNDFKGSTDELAELISNDGKSCNIDELVAKIIQSATPTDMQNKKEEDGESFPKVIEIRSKSRLR